MSALARTPHSRVADTSIVVSALEGLVAGPSNGAVVTFEGTVREHDHGRSVLSLRYEAHPTAASVLGELVDAVARRHPLAVLAAEHRVGDLQVGERAFVVVAAAAHRSEAFDACRDLVDTVKEGLPVWKLQVFADGTQEWVNCA
ncbi:MAG: molybdenum cofactor biosynthesis protein MoaE [Actinomycetes bacterium]